MACFVAVRATLLLIVSATSLACSEPVQPVPEPPKPEPAPVHVVEPIKVERVDRPRVAPPANGCTIELEQAVAPGTRGLALSFADGEALAVARQDELALYQLGESWREGPRLKLTAPIARIGAVCGKQLCELAFVDQRMHLYRTRLDASGLSSLQELATQVDRRFAPALALQGERVLIAYTTLVDERMHVRLLGVRAGEVEPVQDITPAGASATAATFLLGASSPTLIAIDAHAGISPLLEFPIEANGKARDAIVGTPVSQPFEPPLLAAVQWEHGPEVMFTVVGKLAMTAVGRIPLRTTTAIKALSPSRGYGELSFAVARSAKTALFACEVPVASSKNAERMLELTRSDGMRYDSGPVLAAPATAPSLARVRDAYLLAFTRGSEVHAALVRCSE